MNKQNTLKQRREIAERTRAIDRKAIELMTSSGLSFELAWQIAANLWATQPRGANAQQS